jgi:beta-lactam-binding protein with PASTA domain
MASLDTDGPTSSADDELPAEVRDAVEALPLEVRRDPQRLRAILRDLLPGVRLPPAAIDRAVDEAGGPLTPPDEVVPSPPFGASAGAVATNANGADTEVDDELDADEIRRIEAARAADGVDATSVSSGFDPAPPVVDEPAADTDPNPGSGQVDPPAGDPSVPDPLASVVIDAVPATSVGAARRSVPAPSGVRAETGHVGWAAAIADTAEAEDDLDDEDVLEASDAGDGNGASGSRRWWVIAVAVFMAVVFGGAAVAVNSRGGGSGQLEVPGVVGLSQEAAVDRIEALGSNAPEVRIVQERSDEARPGQVLEQSPAAGERIGFDGTITLTVAVGPDAKVPDVGGMTREKAAVALADAGFGARITTSASETVPEGQVISTDPAIGEQVPTGSVVRVTISSGPKAVKVPDVTGKNYLEAAKLLQDAGFKVRTVNEDSAQPAGTALRTDPVAGRSAKAGSTVTLVVSAVKTTTPENETTVDPTTTPTTSGGGGGGAGVTPTQATPTQANPTVAPTAPTTQTPTTARPTTCRTITDSPGYFDPDSGDWVPAQTHQECG